MMDQINVDTPCEYFFTKKYIIVQDEINIQDRSIDQKSNNTMSVMLCAGATFIKKNSCLVARIVSFDTVGMYLLTFRALEPYPSKDRFRIIELRN